MTTQSTPIDWHRRLIHEGAHAVASLVLLDHAADIEVMYYVDEDGNLQDRARFKFKPELQVRSPEKPNTPAFEDQKIPEQVQVIAAGGIGETICCGGEPQGRANDMWQIEQFLRIVGLTCKPVYDLAIADKVADYPTVRQLLEEHQEAIVRIGEVAYANFQLLGLGVQEQFKETIVLTAQEVRRLFENRT